MHKMKGVEKHKHVSTVDTPFDQLCQRKRICHGWTSLRLINKRSPISGLSAGFPNNDHIRWTADEPWTGQKKHTPASVTHCDLTGFHWNRIASTNLICWLERKKLQYMIGRKGERR